VRGEDNRERPRRDGRERFTPTCVGKTCGRVGGWLLLAVHPHVRGEDAPPRHRPRASSRFTPTCVGKTKDVLAAGEEAGGSPPRAWGRPEAGSRSRPWSTVHPHVRGEDASRGGRLLVLLRFTPTCVGKTRTCCSWVIRTNGSPPRAWGRLSLPAKGNPWRPVHPHVRGEDEHHRGDHPPGHRFTPTCVGKTMSTFFFRLPLPGSPPRAWGRRRRRRSTRTLTAVHPHVRGEDEQRPVLAVRRLRFTPTCVGKTRRGTGERRSSVRFTPTCVGKTRSAAARAARSCGSPPRAWGRPAAAAAIVQEAPVHPHVRGEDHRGDREGRGPPRFTPTCVGKTHG